MYDYNFPEQLNQKRLTLLLLSIVIPTETSILQNIYKKKRELEIIYYHSDTQNLSIIADRGREVLRKVSLQIQALYPGFIMYGARREFHHLPGVYTSPLTEVNIDKWTIPKSVDVINHLFTYWVRDTNQDGLKNVCEERLTPFSVISANPEIDCKTFSETLSKFRWIIEMRMSLSGSFSIDEEDDFYTMISELNYHEGICVDRLGGIYC
jgi:hypothetical protein